MKPTERAFDAKARSFSTLLLLLLHVRTHARPSIYFRCSFSGVPIKQNKKTPIAFSLSFT